MDSRLVPLVLRKVQLPNWLRGLVPVDWTEPKHRPRECRKLLKVLGASTLDAPLPGSVTDESGRRPARCSIARLTVSISPVQGVPCGLDRASLESRVRCARDQARTPTQVLNRYPNFGQQGLRWDHFEAEGWAFEVDLDGTVTYRIAIAEGAEFMEEAEPAGRSQPGPPRPGVSALWCLAGPMGIVRFWRELVGDCQATGELKVLLEGVSGLYLSFNGLDRRLNPQYPSVWSFTFWNHDGRQAAEDEIRAFKQVSSYITEDELASLTAELFADIGFYFGFRVVDSQAHPIAKIRDVARQVAG